MRVADNPAGEVIMFGLLWSLFFHLLNGIRHLAWDVGYGFKVPTARLTAALVYAGSLVLAVGALVIGIMVRRGLGT
jgi:succinate dehydrogenase / fumarate reductase cytochrome b subunit